MAITIKDVEAAHKEAKKYNKFVRVAYYISEPKCDVFIMWPNTDAETVIENASHADTADTLMQIAG